MNEDERRKITSNDFADGIIEFAISPDEYARYSGETIKSPTTISNGGLILALQRAMLLLAPKGGIASTFTGPL